MERYGIDHADEYRAFLRKSIDALTTDYELGRPVEGRFGLRRSLVRRGSNGHGHLVIYEVDESAKTVNVLHVFHTAQDWRGRLDRDR